MTATSPQPPSRLSWIATPWLITRESMRSFGDNQSLQAAAALACYGFLALMPLLLMLMSLLGLFMRSSDAVLDAVRDLTRNLFPSFDDAILADIMALSTNRAWGAISIVALIWSVTPFAGAMRKAIRRAFKSEHKLNFALGKLLDLGAVLSLLGLFVFLIITRVYFTAARELPLLGFAMEWLAPVTLTTVIVGLFFAVFAPVRLRAGELLAGALSAALLLAVIRPLFALLLEFNPNYGYAFGSLKALFVLIVWAQYTFAVLLFGAEIMANVRRRESLMLRGLFAPPGAKGVRVRPELAMRFVRQLAPNEVLFREGDGGHDMYYIQSGAVRLTVGDQVVRTMRAGDYFGEMSMLLEAPRTATATAEGEAELIEISEANFEILLRENPQIMKQMLKEMAGRLKVTTASMEQRNPPKA